MLHPGNVADHDPLQHSELFCVPLLHQQSGESRRTYAGVNDVHLTAFSVNWDVCLVHFNHLWWFKPLEVLDATVCYFIPVVLSTVLYGRCCRVLWPQLFCGKAGKVRTLITAIADTHLSHFFQSSTPNQKPQGRRQDFMIKGTLPLFGEKSKYGT